MSGVFIRLPHARRRARSWLRVLMSVLILIERVHRLLLLRHFEISTGLYTHEDVAPHPAFCMPANRTEVLVRAILIRLDHDLFRLENRALTSRGEFCTSHRAGDRGDYRKFTDYVCEEHVV